MTLRGQITVIMQTSQLGRATSEVHSCDILITWLKYIYILLQLRLTLLLCTSGRSLDGRVPTIDNSTDATTVLQFKNLLNSEWSTKDRRGCHFPLLPPNQRTGCTHGRASYKHHAYTRLGYLAQSINQQAKRSMNPYTKVMITSTK